MPLTQWGQHVLGTLSMPLTPVWAACSWYVEHATDTKVGSTLVANMRPTIFCLWGNLAAHVGNTFRMPISTAHKSDVWATCSWYVEHATDTIIWRVKLSPIKHQVINRHIFDSGNNLHNVWRYSTIYVPPWLLKAPGFQLPMQLLGSNLVSLRFLLLFYIRN